MSLYYCVYSHTNKKNNKKYIGITSQKPEIRWRKGIGYKNNKYFNRAIEKYGWDGFRHEILYEGLTQEEAERIEISLIKKFNCCDPKTGYNIEKGGRCGDKFTEETKSKISNALKGKPKTEEHKKKISESHKGKRSPESAKEKMRLRMQGNNNPMYGKKRDISEYKTKKVLCVETGDVYISTCEASRSTGIQQSDISKACNGKLKTAGKCHWVFLEGGIK